MQDTAYHAPEEFVYDAPERTSVLAILALIASLVCFIPLTGVLAMGLGVFALIGIGSSKGRVKGTGLAVAGIVIGLLVSVVWVGGLFGFQQILQQFPKMAQPMTDIENSDYDVARQSLTSDAQALATDEAFETFRDAYQAELGSLVSVPAGWDMISSFMELGPAMQDFNSPSMPYKGSLIPMPAEFSNGQGMLILAFDPNAGENPKGGLYYMNLGVATLDGNIFWLIDPATTLTAGAEGESESPELPAGEEAGEETGEETDEEAGQALPEGDADAGGE